MARIRFLMLLAVVALSLSTAGAVAAKPGRPNSNGNKPAQARITWSVPRVEQVVAPGETVQVPVSLTSSVDLSNVTLVISGGLGRVVTIQPATIAALKAGEATNVTLSISVPSQGAHCQGGVVRVRSGNRNIPTPLNVKVSVSGAAGCNG
jgi:uncharacterized membrane protein